MSLLSICQNACYRLSLEAPSAIIGSTNKIAIQLLALAKEEGKQLSRKGSWKVLTSEQTFTTTAASAQTDALPSDLDWIIPETMYNRTSSRKVGGPISPEDWQAIQASLTTLVHPVFRIRGTSLLLTPTPAASETVAFEYITTKWCQSSGGTAQTTWAADTDTAKVDEELHTLGILWRFQRAKGLDYSAEISEYETQVRQALMREGVRPRISTDPYCERGADVVAGTQPDVILTDSGDNILWD
jgi:hypothetical protein